MDSPVSFFWSHLTYVPYVPFCIDSELRFLQPSFFGACYWERWRQEGWSIRLVRLWSCSEFSEYQGSTLAGGSCPVVFLPSSHRQGSDLVLSEQEVHSWGSGHSQALPAGEWFARQVTGMRQGWGQARMPGPSDWVPDLQGHGQEWVQLQQESQQPGPRPDNLGQSCLEHRQIWMGNCAQSIFLEPLFIILQSSTSGIHLYLHFPPTSLQRNKGCAGQQMVC